MNYTVITRNSNVNVEASFGSNKDKVTKMKVSNNGITLLVPSAEYQHCSNPKNGFG